MAKNKRGSKPKPKEEIEKILAEALEHAKTKKLITIVDVVAYLPIGRVRFYQLFPAESKEMAAIKEQINKNKVDIKVGLRKQMYDSNSSSDRIALYKLVGDQDEVDRLNGAKRIHEGEIGTKIKLKID